MDFYMLQSSNGIRVWRNPDRTGLLGGDFPLLPRPADFTKIPANVTTTVCVEGTAEGVTVPSSLSLSVHYNSQNYVNVDSCKMNVFTINSPLDVPGEGKYIYSADVNGGEWVAPSGGNVTIIPASNTPDITFNRGAR